jgi:hypothetical protein
VTIARFENPPFATAQQGVYVLRCHAAGTYRRVLEFPRDGPNLRWHRGSRDLKPLNLTCRKRLLTA